jgi:hypothetical protein
MTPLERQRRDPFVSEQRAQNEKRSKASSLGASLKIKVAVAPLALGRGLPPSLTCELATLSRPTRLLDRASSLGLPFERSFA